MANKRRLYLLLEQAIFPVPARIGWLSPYL